MFKRVSCIGIKLYYITNAMYIKTKFVCVCMRNAETTICSTKMAYNNLPPPFLFLSLFLLISHPRHTLTDFNQLESSPVK